MPTPRAQRTRRRNPETLALIEQIFALRKQGGSFSLIADQVERSPAYCRQLFYESIRDFSKKIENQVEEIRTITKMQAMELQGRGYNLAMFAGRDEADQRSTGINMWRIATERLMALEGIDGPMTAEDELKPFVVVVNQEAVAKGANTFLPPSEKEGQVVSDQ